MKKHPLFLFFILIPFAFLGCANSGSEESNGSSRKELSSQTGSTNRSILEAAMQPIQFSNESLRNKLENLGIGVAKERMESDDFELEDLGGKLRRLSSYRGKVVFLNFWATWCGPCRVEMPSMQRLYNKLKDEGLVIVAVDLQESKKSVKKFVDRYKLTFPILLDKNGKVAIIYGARSIPTTYLTDRDGYVFAGAVGAREWDAPKTISIFREILQTGVVFN